MKKGLVFCVCALALPVSASEPLTMRVSPAVSFAPAQITVRTVVEIDAANRALEIVAQSADFYRRSSIELDGERASRLNVFELKNLPSGTYEVTSILVGAEGPRATVSRRFRVAAAAGSSSR